MFLSLAGLTTAHAVGGTLLAILIGPYAASLALTVVLTAKAFFIWGWRVVLALKANIFNMAIVMPFRWLCYYSLFRKHTIRKRAWRHCRLYLSINAAAFLAGVGIGLATTHLRSWGQPLYNNHGLSITVPAMLGSSPPPNRLVELSSPCDLPFCQTSRSLQRLYTPSRSIQLASFVQKIRWVLLCFDRPQPTWTSLNGTAFGEWSAERNWVACFRAKFQQGSKMVLIWCLV